MLGPVNLQGKWWKLFGFTASQLVMKPEQNQVFFLFYDNVVDTFESHVLCVSLLFSDAGCAFNGS